MAKVKNPKIQCRGVKNKYYFDRQKKSGND